MRIVVASDHRGFQIKEQIVDLLRQQGHEVEDAGTSSLESVDYPDFAANKFKGVRAAPCTDEVTAEMSRRHNDLNVLCLSADLMSAKMVERMVNTWINTEFEAGRHLRRIEKINQLEIEGGCS